MEQNNGLDKFNAEATFLKCQRCNAELLQKRIDATYCSKKCKQASKRERDRVASSNRDNAFSDNRVEHADPQVHK